MNPIHILSLGAGVQSSTLALMAAAGEVLPMPVAAIFADTGDEPKEVYVWLEKLRGMLPFLIHTVSRSRLSEHILEWGHSQIPCFTRSDETGKATLGKRQCTKHWKIVPIQNGMRAATGLKRVKLSAGHFVSWIGISTDEADRIKDSRVRWIKNRYPLIEKKMSRRDCQKWLAHRGLVVPKSACVYCPLRAPRQFRATKDAGGYDWETVLRVSRILEARGEFLTSSLLPIDQVAFSTEEERGQGSAFGNECEGMCGV